MIIPFNPTTIPVYPVVLPRRIVIELNKNGDRISKHNHTEEVIANKDFHLNVVMVSLEGREVRNYTSEPKRRHLSWKKNRESHQPTYATVCVLR